ncbi:hypothetical protein BJX70DRAFT_404841 [Aspergillus crustosus]
MVLVVDITAVSRLRFVSDANLLNVALGRACAGLPLYGVGVSGLSGPLPGAGAV